MMPALLAGSVATAWMGPLAGLMTAGTVAVARRRSRAASPEPPLRLVLLLLLVELRAGQSALGALLRVADRVPEDRGLRRVTRLALVRGLVEAISAAPERLRPMVSQLARAQSSGASLSDMMRDLLERDLAEERARRLAAARALPVKLMVPITLFVLPGMILLLYAPSLLGLFRQLTGGLT